MPALCLIRLIAPQPYCRSHPRRTRTSPPSPSPSGTAVVNTLALYCSQGEILARLVVHTTARGERRMALSAAMSAALSAFVS